MMRMIAAEFLKLRRSWMPLWSGLIVLVASGLGLAVLPILSDPKTQTEIAKSGGVFAQAVAAGAYEPSWANYLRIGVQGMSGSWGILTFGLVTAYLFGREFKEGAAKNMLTLPIRREYVVAAKLIVLAVWVFTLGLLSVLLTAGTTVILGVGGFTWNAILVSVGETLGAIAPLYLTLPLVAWFAVRGKGYLQPMLYSLGVMMVGNALVQTPVSQWFPWNMPLHMVGASWYPIPPSPVLVGSWAVAVGVFVASVAALMWQIDHADSTG
jgi:ABC-type transport system involved in multi-copper enzyme maturation permease subunit